MADETTDTTPDLGTPIFTITVPIPVSHKDDVIEAFAESGYQDTVPNPDATATEKTIPNPLTKEQYCIRRVRQFVIDVSTSYAVRKAAKIASDAQLAIADTDAANALAWAESLDA